MRRVAFLVLFFLFFIGSPIDLLAKDLGTLGQVYPILEEDLLVLIQNRFQALKDSGEWDRIQKKAQEDIKRHIDRPFSISLPKTIAARKFTFDPSFEVQSDVTDLEGHVVAAQGTRFNPLSRVSLHQALLFYDADDPKQVAWAQKMDQTLKGADKLILVNGSVSLEAKRFGRIVYFDQQGRITTKLQIQHVPAYVHQEGQGKLDLMIEEQVP